MGTFTADVGGIQTLTLSGGEPVINALTIGTADTETDITPPTISSLNPADNATDVAVNANLSVTFSEAIAIGTGDITLKNLTDGPTYDVPIPVTDGDQVSVAGAVLTINPTADLATGKDYAIQIDATAIKDLAPTPNFFAGIAADTTWNFTTAVPDTTAPEWIETWPQAAQLSSTSITVHAQTNEAGTAYYVVLPGGATPPPGAEQVKAGTDGNGALALKSGNLPLIANTEATGTVTDLTADTTYDVYFVAEDGVPNLQASPSMVSVSLVSTGMVIWDPVQPLTGSTDIVTTGLTNVAGANFGITTGTTTIVNNGVGETGGVDVEFKSLFSGQSVELSNGITVAADSTWGNWGNNVNNSAVTGNFGIVLDSNIGIEEGSPTSATITLSGLTNGTQYKIQFFADSTGNNSQTISGSDPMNTLTGKFVTGTFTADADPQVLDVSYTTGNFGVANALTIGTVSGGGPDTTAPEWIATWPQAEPLSSTSLTVRAKINEPGTAYYVVLAAGATPPPSAAQVKAGTDGNNAVVSSSGSLTLTANTEATAPVGSLSPSTAYDVYFVAEDAANNLQDPPAMVNASTPAPDTIAPEWIATWPQAEQLSSTSITVRAQTNEAGNAYYVVLATGATPPPSAEQVKAGTDGNGALALKSGSLVLTANTEATAPVTDLTADTTYDVYFVAEDIVPNLQTAPVPVSVTLVTPAFAWGAWTPVTDETAILTPTGYTYGGVNFNGSNTTIGSVVFTGIPQNDSATVAGITVATSGFAFQSTSSGNSNVVSAVGSPQTWATVLDRVIGDDTASGPIDAKIDLSGLTEGTKYTVQFFSSTPDGDINATTKISSVGVDSPEFGAHTGGQTRYIIAEFTADGTGSQSFSITGAEPTFGALVIGVQSAGNTFTNWISGYDVGSLTGFNDDADGDGLDNGLENFLGTVPNVGNAGLTAGTLSGNTFTFTHPQNATPASDVSAPAYTWSTDLVNWNASGASAGGITVDLAPTTDTPVAGTTTVTATVTGTVPAKLFVRLGVTQL